MKTSQEEVRVGLSGSWVEGGPPGRRAEMSGFIEVKRLCARLSLVCLYYYSFRLWLTLWNKKSYKNPRDSHFHSFLFSLILFGNWPKASLPGILLCVLISSTICPALFYHSRGRREAKLDISQASKYLGFRMWFGGCQSDALLVERGLE